MRCPLGSFARGYAGGSLTAALTAALRRRLPYRAAGRAEATARSVPELALALGPDGALTATGMLPQGLSPEALTAALPGIDIAGIDRTGDHHHAGTRSRAGCALHRAAALFGAPTSGSATGGLAIEGRLRSGLSAAGVEAALRAALGTGWRLDLRLTETAPEAGLVIARTGEGLAVSGLLPDGLSRPRH